MEWRGQRESESVEDREGQPDMAGGPDDGQGMPGGYPGMPGRPILVGGGLGTFVLLIILGLFGINPLALLQGPNQPPAEPQRVEPHRAPVPPQPGIDEHEGVEKQNPAHAELKHFVRVVLADTEDVWDVAFREMGKTYRKPRLVLYSGHTQAGCGLADAATGPFYCPADETIYLDLNFFAELRNRFHAPGEFAEAYVIAHEVGHHVQKLLGIMDKVDAQRSRKNKADANHLSVKLELQADFLAGVWANRANKMKHIIENGDVDAAIHAADAIGDDTLQKQSQGYAVPDSFTHGTSSQRIHWFRLGLQTGDVRQGNTFGSNEL